MLPGRSAGALGCSGRPRSRELLARGDAPPLRATGPVGHAVNVAVFLAIYGTAWYAPGRCSATRRPIFYGASMLLAAVRGYAGCEVLAVSNLALGRDDQIGCACSCPSTHSKPTPGNAAGTQLPPPNRGVNPATCGRSWWLAFTGWGFDSPHVAAPPDASRAVIRARLHRH